MAPTLPDVAAAGRQAAAVAITEWLRDVRDGTASGTDRDAQDVATGPWP